MGGGSRGGRMTLQNAELIRMKKFEKAKKYRDKAQVLYKNEDFFETLIQLQKSVEIFQVESLNAEIRDK
jgi:hypothetical protein